MLSGSLQTYLCGVWEGTVPAHSIIFMGLNPMLTRRIFMCMSPLVSTCWAVPTARHLGRVPDGVSGGVQGLLVHNLPVQRIPMLKCWDSLRAFPVHLFYTNNAGKPGSWLQWWA